MVLLIKIKLAEALGKFGTSTSVEPLLTLLNDEDSDIGEVAAQVLTGIRRAELAEGVLMSLHSIDSRVKKTALRSFFYYHDNPKHSEQLLLIAQQDADAGIRKITSDTVIHYLKKLASTD